MDGDVHHGGGGSGPVPVLLAGSDPDHITRPNFLHRPTPALHPAAAGRNDKRLAERMGVPRSARARLESYTGALKKRRIGRLDKWINPHRAGEPFRRTFDGSLRTRSLNLHLLHSSSRLRIASFRVPGLLLWSKANQHLHARLAPLDLSIFFVHRAPGVETSHFTPLYWSTGSLSIRSVCRALQFSRGIDR